MRVVSIVVHLLTIACLPIPWLRARKALKDLSRKLDAGEPGMSGYEVLGSFRKSMFHVLLLSALVTILVMGQLETMIQH